MKSPGARRGRDDPQVVDEPHGIVDGSGGEHAAILLGDLGKAARHATSAAIDAAPHTPGHARLPSAVIAGRARPHCHASQDRQGWQEIDDVLVAERRVQQE